MEKHTRSDLTLPALFLISRLILISALPLEGFRGFGDLLHFYNLAGLGWPYLTVWVEFPPLFPFISRIIYLAAGGRQHIYDYLLVLLLSLAQAASILVFQKISEMLFNQADARHRTVVYTILLIGLTYGWWYFDPLPVLALLLAIFYLLKGNDIRAAGMLAVGALFKFFPLIALAGVWRARPLRKAVLISVLTFTLMILLYAGLWLISPRVTSASINYLGGKGSLETVWALMDKNFMPGNLPPESDHLDPEKALIVRDKPSRISYWITLIPFGVLGFWLFFRARIKDHLAIVGFIGMAWCIFFLWFPVFSPQWILYLIPIILLGSPTRQGTMIAFAIVMVCVLEWPMMLSRGYTWGLYVTVPVRAFLFALSGYILWTWGVKRSEIGSPEEASP